jgi:hypothetical protein
MTTPTVPQDVYQRHEREWQMLREAIAKTRKSDKDDKNALPVSREKPQWNFEARQ